MGRHKFLIISMMIVFFAGAAGVFARNPSVNFLRLYSTQQTNTSAGANFAPFSYNYIGAGKFDSDTAEIYAIRIEFRPDSVLNTTGNGLFMRSGIRQHEEATREITSAMGLRDIPLSRKARKEFEWYASDSVYIYDHIPHNIKYFNDHLTSLADYYREVSNNNIRIGWRIFPDGDFGSYRLNREIASFSPGLKRRDETFEEFNIRVGRGLMQFVSQSVNLAATAAGAKNPFADLRQDANGRIYKIGRNNEKIPVFILLIHAGVSALTDGGLGGAGSADSPNDLTDAFIGEELFRFFNIPDSLGGFKNSTFGNIRVETGNFAGRNRTGILLHNKDGERIILSELMMVSSTANQDSLNWGINGILVNQFARQIGIPDLYSTSSGISGAGRFCIMDFAGYSAGQGFIPPRPSAFVRSFMGWERPTHAQVGGNYEINTLGENLFLIPINSKEYYLVENRQRNLTENPNLFVFDTLNGKPYIASDFRVNLTANIERASSVHSVVMRVRSRDVGLPASGVCVWHIDEKLIENRLRHNMLNSDSSFRAVHLVEADGITDIGVKFTDFLGFPSFDYGGAADVFPHTSVFSGRSEITNTMSPTTAPATIANDGGNTFLRMVFANKNPNGRREVYYHARQSQNSRFNEYEVVNISDPIITMNVSRETSNISPVAKFPVRVKGQGGFFPLLTADILRGNGQINDLVALSKDGNLTILAANGDIIFTDSIPAVNMPTMVGNSLFIPCQNKIMIYNGETGEIRKDSIMNINISSNITNIKDNIWFAGTKDGRVVRGNGRNIERISNYPEIGINLGEIYSVAKFDDENAVLISESGQISFSGYGVLYGIHDIKAAFPPFKIAVFNEKIAITDRKNGLWITDWHKRIQNAPIDWAGIFRENEGREHIPDNFGYISAADLTGDGSLNILIGGTNGVYAFDEKGNLLANYPALLDRANWSIRQSVQSTPISAQTANGETMVFFTTTTGDNRSYYQTKITSAHRERGVVYFNDISNRPDSISGLSAGFIDTLLIFNDSIIMPYFAPGGLIEMRLGKTGKRPELQVSTDNAGRQRVFPYLISIGSPLTQGVVLDTIDRTLNLIAVADDGLLYRFELPRDKFPPVRDGIAQTNMVGGNAQRQFNFVAVGGTPKPISQSLEYFYSYPNPVRIRRGENASVNFRYELGDNASSAMLTIYTIQGQKVFEERNLPATRGVNEYVLRDLSRFGSAVYRARLSVRFGSDEKVLFWKMAVLR